MIKDQLAIISDIHGNSYALKEVIDDIKKRKIKTIINLGDSLYGPLDPIGTYELLEINNIISISGNEDRLILENLNKQTELITLEYVKSKINNSILDWLNSLPFDMIHKNKIYCCHASPKNDSEYLIETLDKNFVGIKNKYDIDNILQDIEQNIIICGHSHVPNIIESGNKLIVNPGSVGLPAYDDDLPIYHKMQNYNPRANYSILKVNGDSVSVERISLDYNFEESARLAEKNNHDNWAKWIRTGIV